MSLEPEGALDLYQEVSRYERPGSVQADRGHLLPEPGQPVPLPPPTTEGGMPLWEAVTKRRSLRKYTSQPLTPEEVSQLLWATQGVTGRAGTLPLLAAPSAGACYPIETYLSVHRVEGLAPGLYHYQVAPAALEPRAVGDLNRRLARASLGQGFLREAAVAFLWTAVLGRTRSRYWERALRYIYLDAGHLCQNLYLAAAALGLGCCAVGAFFDDEVETLLGVDGRQEFALYLASVGRVRGNLTP